MVHRVNKSDRKHRATTGEPTRNNRSKAITILNNRKGDTAASKEACSTSSNNRRSIMEVKYPPKRVDLAAAFALGC